MKTWASKHGDKVRICTDVVHDQVPAYLNAMDILCAPSQTTPSWKEQFGRMVVESFASGVAFVGSDSGEIPHVVKDSGVIVRRKGRFRLGKSTHPFARKPGPATGTGQPRFRTVHGEFAWPIVARSYLNFFDSVLDGRGARPC